MSHHNWWDNIPRERNMVKKIRKNRFGIVMIAIALSILTVSTVFAEEKETYGMKSKGKIEIDENSDGVADVVFDATDIYNIAAKCQ